MAPLISSFGFTADVRPRTTTEGPRHRRGRAIVTAALGLALIVALSTLSALARVEIVDDDRSVNTSLSPAYEFKVHALNSTFKNRVQNGTTFRFNETELPFDFPTLSFGDYRLDLTFSHKYYAGSGILVNASGTNATITLRENTGRFVSRVEYHGQTQVVFNGRVESVTYPKTATIYEGTDQMIQDWRNGTWAPGDGILLEHPSNVTLSGASLFLMILEPNVMTEIPEFEPLVPVAAILMIALLVRRRICSVKE